MKKQLEVENYPDVPDLDQYQNKPVENYGLTLLQGMGFTQGRGIGKRAVNKLTNILVLKPRPKGLGLGAQLFQQPQKQKFDIGDLVQITIQPHQGLTGIVSKALDQQTFQIELQPSKSIIKTPLSSLKKISVEQMKKVLEQTALQPEKKKHRLKWVLPDIRVKIINPKSQHYLKKVTVTELLGKRQFQCRDLDGNNFTNFTEADLQTSIPKPGGLVLVLKSTQKGEKGVLLDRKKSKGQVMVQISDSLKIFKLTEDDICQYVGN